MFPRTHARRRRLWLIGSFPKKSRSHPTRRTWRSWASGRRSLSLPYPGHEWFGWLDRWLVLAVAPVTARALFVVRGPAGRANHGPIISVSDGIPATVSRRGDG